MPIGVIFKPLKHIESLNWTPIELDQWCDNTQAVKNNMEHPYRTVDMMGSDMNLVLAIHQVESRLSFAVKCRHVYRHQDQNRRTQERRRWHRRIRKQETRQVEGTIYRRAVRISRRGKYNIQSLKHWF